MALIHLLQRSEDREIGCLDEWASAVLGELSSHPEGQWPEIVAFARTALDSPVGAGGMSVSTLADAYFALDVLAASYSTFGRANVVDLHPPAAGSSVDSVIEITLDAWPERGRRYAYRHLYMAVRSRARRLADSCQTASSNLDEWHRDLGRLLVSLQARREVPVTGDPRRLVPVETRSRLDRMRRRPLNTYVVASELPHPIAQSCFTHAELEDLRRDEVFLAEAWANAVACLVCEYDTTEGQDKLMNQIIDAAETDGSFHARLLLRAMRSKMVLSPAYFTEIEERLRPARERPPGQPPLTRRSTGSTD
jgi:hypothetical protein